jgi:hypothetical protein
MDKIIELSEQIDKLTNINNKVELIKKMNEMIEVEKQNLQYLLDNDIKKLKIKTSPKYKKMTIDELEEEFKKEDVNVNEKISIYLAIDRYYTNIEEELFDVE